MNKRDILILLLFLLFFASMAAITGYQGAKCHESMLASPDHNAWTMQAGRCVLHNYPNKDKIDAF